MKEWSQQFQMLNVLNYCCNLFSIWPRLVQYSIALSERKCVVFYFKTNDCYLARNLARPLVKFRRMWRHFRITFGFVVALFIPDFRLLSVDKRTQTSEFNHLTMENKVISAALYIVFILTLGKVSSFNLDIESAVIYGGPDQSGLFGYTVATHSYNGQKWWELLTLAHKYA